MLRLILLTIAAAASAAERPLATIGRGPAPKVDGKLNEPAWRTCAQMLPFIQADGAGLARVQTRALAFYSAQGLHVAFVCDEPQPEKLLAFCKTRDEGVWRDDCIELFLQRPGSKTVYHIIVNSRGTVYDDRDGNPKWNAALAVKAFKGARAWGVEMSIPWPAPGGPAKPGETWRANFCRERKVKSELSCWSCTYGHFLKPERFGELRFAAAAARVESLALSPPAPGANRARLKVVLPPGAAGEVAAAGGKPVALPAGGGQAEVVYPLGLSDEEVVFTVRVAGRDAWRAVVPASVQPAPKLRELEDELNAFRQLQASLPADSPLRRALPAQLAPAARAAEALRNAIQRSLKSGKPLGLAAYKKLNGEAGARARQLQASRWPVWTQNDWLDVDRRARPASLESITELNWTALVNEYESGNVIITNLGSEPLRLRLLASDFTLMRPLAPEKRNLVRNGGMNDANRDRIPDGWMPATGDRRGFAVEPAPGRGRVLAIRRSRPSKGFTLRQNVALQPGKRYTLEFWVKCDHASPNVRVHVINAGWTWGPGSPWLGGTHGWRRVRISFTPPKSRVYQVVIRDAGRGLGDVWLDDFRLVEGIGSDVTFAGFRPRLLVADWQALRGGRVVADPLIPLNRAGRLDVPPGESRQVWLTLPARDLPPGDYEATLEIRPLAQAKLKAAPAGKRVALRLRIAPLRLKASPEFAVYNWDYARNADYVRDLFEHKVNFFLVSTGMPHPEFDAQGRAKGRIDYSRYDRLLRVKMRYARRAGGRILFAYGVIRDFHFGVAKRRGWAFRSAAWDRAFRYTYTHWLRHLHALGLRYDDFCVQVWDEATGANIRYVVEGGKLLREIDPDVRLVMDGAQSLAEVKRIDPYIDVWIPHLTMLLRRDPDGKLLAYYKRTGEPVYTYTCSTRMKALSPYSYHRLKPWQAARLGLDGVFYWAYNSWRGDPWNDFDGPIADCGVIYPPAWGKPITSRRWEASREGVEDWQLLRLVKRLADAAGPQGDAARKLIVDALNQVTAEPKDVGRAAAYRLRLIAAAEQLAGRAPLRVLKAQARESATKGDYLGAPAVLPRLDVSFATNRPAAGKLLYRVRGDDAWREAAFAQNTTHRVRVELPPESTADWLIVAWDAAGRVAAYAPRAGAR